MSDWCSFRAICTNFQHFPKGSSQLQIPYGSLHLVMTYIYRIFPFCFSLTPPWNYLSHWTSGPTSTKYWSCTHWFFHRSKPSDTFRSENSSFCACTMSTRLSVHIIDDPSFVVTSHPTWFTSSFLQCACVSPVAFLQGLTAQELVEDTSSEFRNRQAIVPVFTGLITVHPFFPWLQLAGAARGLPRDHGYSFETIVSFN